MVFSPRASARGYRTAALSWSTTIEEWIRENAIILNGILQGHSNATGVVTLTPSSISTTITNRNIALGMAILLAPLTENAAKEDPWPYVTAYGDGTATLTHTSSGTIDRKYVYVLIGGRGAVAYSYPSVHASDFSADFS